MKLPLKIPLMFLFLATIFYSCVIIYINHILYPFVKDSTLFFKALPLFGIMTIVTYLPLAALIRQEVSVPLRVLIKKISAFNLYQKSSFQVSRRWDEIGDLYEGFGKMADRLVEAHGEQLDMIMAITHDIKTPLTSIRGFVELILTNQEVPDQDKNEYMRVIYRKTDSIVELLEELTNYSKNESELMTVEMAPLSVKPLYESIAREYEAELAGLGYELIWEEPMLSTDQVNANETMIRRVFANVVSNAVRYAGVTKLVVRFKAYSERYSVVFRIEDNGIGVPEDKLGLIFNKFYTSDGSRQRAIGGTGLGLSICKSIVARFNGEIYAYRSSGNGLGIQFRIPLIRVHNY